MADFFDEPQSSAGRVFDQSSDPWSDSPAVSFPPGIKDTDPFATGKNILPEEDDDITDEERERLQAAERAYQELVQKLYEKESEERGLKEERQAEARQALAKWREERLRQTEQRKSMNREQEAAFLDARKKFKAGNPWKNVSSMIDFKEKSDGKDVSRMRSVLLAKKNEG